MGLLDTYNARMEQAQKDRDAAFEKAGAAFQKASDAYHEAIGAALIAFNAAAQVSGDEFHGAVHGKNEEDPKTILYKVNGPPPGWREIQHFKLPKAGFEEIKGIDRPEPAVCVEDYSAGPDAA